MADEFSPGDIINDLELVQALMFKLWGRMNEGKEARLSVESVRYATYALQHYYMKLTREDPFNGMHFKIQRWPWGGDRGGVVEIIGQLKDAKAARAAFDVFVEVYEKEVPRTTTALSLSCGAQLFKNHTIKNGRP
ncbi:MULTISPECIES: hypothetical protein [unclassified Beijerinckia]|uniref:hypothetical protein n=1 Tax=unclassified Beijerinckia TaxID=2638183 RepID=UPI001114CC0F|nr:MULTISPECIES: hypothetical protein [unclassified Beijerinckia]